MNSSQLSAAAGSVIGTEHPWQQSAVNFERNASALHQAYDLARKSGSLD